MEGKGKYAGLTERKWKRDRGWWGIDRGKGMRERETEREGQREKDVERDRERRM